MTNITKPSDTAEGVVTGAVPVNVQAILDAQRESCEATIDAVREVINEVPKGASIGPDDSIVLVVEYIGDMHRVGLKDSAQDLMTELIANCLPYEDLVKVAVSINSDLRADPYRHDRAVSRLAALSLVAGIQQHYSVYQSLVALANKEKQRFSNHPPSRLAGELGMRVAFHVEDTWAPQLKIYFST